MGLEWQVISEPIDDEELSETWLRRGWEPFAVAPDETGKMSLWMKQQVFTERNEAKSSTHAENTNWAGKETTE